MDQEQLVAPEADKIVKSSKDKSTISTKGQHVRIDVGQEAGGPRWLRNVNDYVRRQPREYDVTRFG